MGPAQVLLAVVADPEAVRRELSQAEPVILHQQAHLRVIMAEIAHITAGLMPLVQVVVEPVQRGKIQTKTPVVMVAMEPLLVFLDHL